MKITETVLNEIENIANSKNFEIGGILGTKDNDVISFIVPDLPDKSDGCRFEYFPNIDFLNEQIEKWADEEISLCGLFHTHFSGSTTLSDADKEYIKAIMFSAKGICDCLYFPIFTLPDNKLTAYKAYYEQEKIIINKDEVIIVKNLET